MPLADLLGTVSRWTFVLRVGQRVKVIAVGQPEGALYKTLHDGRRKLRSHLYDHGLAGERPCQEGHLMDRRTSQVRHAS
jgi:hypothetical protein